MDKADSDAILAQLLLERGFARREHIDECLMLIRELRAGRASEVPTLAELLLKRGYLTPATYEATVKLGRESIHSAPEMPEEVERAQTDPSNRLGAFVLLNVLGKGGMGDVYRGWSRKLGRYVAIKFIRTREPEDVARFVREAQIVAKLNHPNIAQVYELGERAGEPFIVMQYIQGTTIDRAGLDLREKIRVIRDVARALEYAHKQGIIHRDMKPANVMVEGSDHHPYVMDFGLARQMRVDSAISQSGLIVGTPQFMSPEQARGLKTIDARSDIYSLGATLYALLAGRPPHELRLDTDVVAALLRIAEEDPIPPRRFNPRIPEEVETITLKALERDRERRYQAASELADDLERFLQGDPVLARRPTLVYRVRKKVAKHPLAAISAGLAVLLAVGFGAYLLGAGMMRASQRLITRCIEQMKQTGDSANGWWVVGRARYMLGNARDAEAAYDRGLQVQPNHERCLLYKGLLLTSAAVRLRAKVGLYMQDEALALLKRAQECLELASKTDGRMLIEYDTARGYEYAMRSENADEYCARMLQKWSGRDFYEEFYLVHGLSRGEFLEKAVEKALQLRPGFYEALVWRAVFRRDNGNFLGAIADLDRALQINPRYVPAYEARASMAMATGSYQQMVESLTKAIEIAPTEYLYSHRGVAHRLAGNLQAALEDFDRAEQIRPDYWQSQINRGTTLLTAGRLEEALQCYDRVLSMSPNNSFALSGRARVFADKGDYPAALRECDRAIQAGPKYYEPYAARAELWLELGNYAKAIEDFRAAIDIYPRDPQVQAQLADALRKSGDFRTAIEAYTAALRLRPFKAEWYIDRANALCRIGEFKRGLEDCDRAIQLEPTAMGYLSRGGAYWSLSEQDPAKEAKYLKAAEADFSKALETEGAPAGIREPARRALEKIRRRLQQLGREY